MDYRLFKFNLTGMAEIFFKIFLAFLSFLKILLESGKIKKFSWWLMKLNLEILKF